MRKLLLALCLLLLLLPALALAGGLGGLLGTSAPVPDPAQIIGYAPTLFEEEVLCQGVLYTSFAYPMPEDPEAFMADYTALAASAGYTVTPSSLPTDNGKEGPFAWCVSAGARHAWLVPDYMGCLLLMVNNDLEFAHMPTPVPTAPPTPAPTEYVAPSYSNDGSAYMNDVPGRHVEYETVKVDCPGCVGGKCSVCNGSGTYRMYGEAVPCDRYCSACDGLGYIIQEKPVWVYD